jgi:hypothetical protein
MPRDTDEANQLASTHFDEAYHRTAISTVTLAECGGPLHSVKPWRIEDVLGKPLGRRG